MLRQLIVGVAGGTLSDDEAGFIRDARPCGLILFARNCLSHDQIRRLVSDVQTACGTSRLLVLIDQEGGRVQRLRPPLGRALPPAALYGERYGRDPESAIAAARAVAHLVGQDLRALGINTVCAPVADVPVAGAHDVIGDRAFSRDPEVVAVLARAVIEGFMAAGVLPVIKHVPGHGRATADSHFDLPVVTATRQQLTASDFVPFRRLSDVPAAMTAHVVYAALDPNRPASISEPVTREIIRGEMGFDGLLMSDDLSMQALRGGMADRARAVLAAGSDVALHCNGKLPEMEAAAAGCGPLDGIARARFERALAVTDAQAPFDQDAAERHLADMLTNCAKPVESV